MDLSGHSGCIVKLLDGPKGHFVRKKSTNIDYNKRLQLQFEKQKTMKIQGINVVPVINYGFEDGLFFFDMEYINGCTFAEFLKTCNITILIEYTNKLLEHIIGNTFDSSAKDSFVKKIDSVSNEIKRNNIVKKNDELQKIIQESVRILNDYSWNYVVKSECHGDYTLENIMIDNENRLYAIDLLDSFYDSWEIDVAKLLQDIDLGWSYRFEIIDDNLKIRQMIMKGTVISKILSMENGDEIVRSIYYILLLNVLRIIPYTTDDKTFTFIEKSLTYLCNKINGELIW